MVFYQTRVSLLYGVTSNILYYIFVVIFRGIAVQLSKMSKPINVVVDHVSNYLNVLICNNNFNLFKLHNFK